MENPIKDLKDQLRVMFDKCEDKDTVEQIGKLNNLVDTIEAEHKRLSDENKDLIKDYKELMKHTSFQPSEVVKDDVPNTEDLSFESFLKASKK